MIFKYCSCILEFLDITAKPKLIKITPPLFDPGKRGKGWGAISIEDVVAAM